MQARVKPQREDDVNQRIEGSGGVCYENIWEKSVLQK